jgi:hypothetical protein
MVLMAGLVVQLGHIHAKPSSAFVIETILQLVSRQLGRSTSAWSQSLPKLDVRVTSAYASTAEAFGNYRYGR